VNVQMGRAPQAHVYGTIERAAPVALYEHGKALIADRELALAR
jgi:hypothetical protein